MEEPATVGEIYNVGSNERITIHDLAERVKELTGSSSAIVLVPYEQVFPHGVAEEMFHRVPSIEKIRSVVGWEPERNLDQILADVIEHRRAEAAGQRLEPV